MGGRKLEGWKEHFAISRVRIRETWNMGWSMYTPSTERAWAREKTRAGGGSAALLWMDGRNFP